MFKKGIEGRGNSVEKSGFDIVRLMYFRRCTDCIIWADLCIVTV